jgi:flagellar biogenesis protein FliO
MGAGQTASALSALAPAMARLWAMVQGIACRVKVRRRERSLRVCETLSLGERRLLMVVQFEQRRFLIGATNQSISLLQCLDDGHAASRGHEDSGPDNSLRNGTR